MNFDRMKQRAAAHGLTLQRASETATMWKSGYVLTFADGEQKHFSTLGKVDHHLWLYFDSQKKKVYP